MDDELRRIQMSQLKVAKEIHRICQKNDIPYILIGGTLLGAVRHKGFIPWDDDLDIGFTRDNYERFLQVAKKELNQKYFLQEWRSDPTYAYPFGKIRINGTKFVESSVKNKDSHDGIFVDIFPYDKYPEGAVKRKFLGIRLTLLRQVLVLKTGYCEYVSFTGKTSRQFAKMLLFPFLYLYSCIFSKKSLIDQFDRIASRYNGQNCDLYYEHSGASQYGKWVIPSECFDHRMLMQFEDTEFSVPVNFDKYLSIGYGNYMELPPEDKRTNRHGIIEIAFLETEE